ncbi:hypothetical protein A2U01_0080038, partial [Trifolium medium]|nr:hypothetical protein [Trifolium medium]
GQRIPYRKKPITHGINHTPAVPDLTPPRQHLATTPTHHLHVRTVAAATTTPSQICRSHNHPISDPSHHQHPSQHQHPPEPNLSHP